MLKIVPNRPFISWLNFFFSDFKKYWAHIVMVIFDRNFNLLPTLENTLNYGLEKVCLKSSIYSFLFIFIMFILVVGAWDMKLCSYFVFLLSTGINRTFFQVEQPRNWASLTYCSLVMCFHGLLMNLVLILLYYYD